MGGLFSSRRNAKKTRKSGRGHLTKFKVTSQSKDDLITIEVPSVQQRKYQLRQAMSGDNLGVGDFEVYVNQKKSSPKMSSSFERDVIKAHNEYRANHNAAPLKQKDELTNFAQKWAKHLASSGKFGHSNHKDYGENIAMTSAKNPTGGEITAMWYDEIHKYDFKRPGFKSGIGHFTQVVWRDSKHIGVGMASGKYGSFVVANYEPRGNWSMTGQFENNVLPPTKAVVKKDVGGADGGEGEGKVETKVTTKVEETTDENGQKIRKTTKTTVTTTTKNGGTSTSTKTEVETKKI